LGKIRFKKPENDRFFQVPQRGLTLLLIGNNFKLPFNNSNPMKKTKTLLLILLCQPLWLIAQTGGTCGTAIPLSLDGVTRTFNTSSSTGNAVVCTNGGYTISSPITWFSVTTNASAEMPLLDITAADSSSCEVAMYTGCNGGNILQGGSSICFDDGWGLWSPAHNFTLLANTTYYLRVKTHAATQLQINAQSYTPTNNLCSGATPVGTVPINDNNACNRPSAEVAPGQLCAYTIENTAFYQFYVASDGVAIINISNISCDNSATNNSNGFQIGFFKGTCGALTPLNCTAGDGSGPTALVQATTPILPAGTKVYVAIDGDAGSNCKYSFQALNAYGVLAETEFKNFSAWKTSDANVLKWISTTGKKIHFVIERSRNGSDFVVIGQVSSSLSDASAINYKFEDNQPLPTSYYRIKQIKENGEISMSNTLRVERKNEKAGKIKIINPARTDLIVQIDSETNETADYSIVSPFGQSFHHGRITLVKGINSLNQTVANLPAGNYVINISSKTLKQSIAFVKLN
jgi:hypothetical protein